MSEPVIPQRAKLFAGILFASEDNLAAAEKSLAGKFGPIDFRSPRIPFTHTGYYDDMGPAINRIFFSFEKLMARDRIAGIKIVTNKLEKKISGSDTRIINIDPGYLTLSNVFLATCKDYSHRTYLEKGVFLENEYRYRSGEFLPWEWTYPDYRKKEYLEFFHRLRDIYHGQIKAAETAGMKKK